MFVTVKRRGSVTLASVVLVAAFASSSCSRKLELSEADQRKLLVTAADLKPWMADHEISAADEKLTAKYSFGSNELDYEYETATHYLMSSLHIESSIRDAKAAFTLIGTAADISLRGKDIERKPCAADAKWGDESKCERLSSGGVAYGTMWWARSGRYVLQAMWVGLGMPAPSAANSVIEAHVAALKTVPELAKKK